MLYAYWSNGRSKTSRITKRYLLIFILKILVIFADFSDLSPELQEATATHTHTALNKDRRLILRGLHHISTGKDFVLKTI